MAWRSWGPLPCGGTIRIDPKKAVQQYKDALSLGYTKSIGDIYAAAGISFDFSQEYVAELMNFVRSELNALS